MIRYMMIWVRNHRWSFTSALLLAAATILAGMGLMASSGYLISRAALRPMIVDLFMITAAVRFFGISRAVVRYFERLLSHDFTFRILSTVRTVLYRALDARPMKWITAQRSGDLMGRLIADVDMLQNAYLRIIIPTAAACIIVAINTLLLWFFDPLMAVVALTFLLGPGLAVPLLAMKLARDSGQVEADTRAAMKVFLVERIQGMQDMLWMGQEQAMQREFGSRQEKLDKIQRGHAGRSGLLEGINTILAHGGAITTLMLAIPMVMEGKLQGVLLAAIALTVLSSFEAVQGLGQAFLQYGHASASAKRVFSVATAHSSDDSARLLPDKLHGKDIRIGKERETDHVKAAGEAMAGDISGNEAMPAVVPASFDIRFEEVSFAYDQGVNVLSDVSLLIPEGSRVAIVGPSGSGKTTLINLMLRFYDVDQGCVKLGGVDVRRLDMDVLRAQFSVVDQDVYIFQRSLRDNLLLGRPSASDQDIANVLDRVGLGAYSGQLDMVPGSLGMRLSGGERQLLALARALLKDAPVFLFDEATAHLDAQSENQVIDTIRETVRSRTQIMITHRQSLRNGADQVIYLGAQ